MGAFEALRRRLQVRIVAGSAKGRKLASLRGRAIRPTSDGTREAIFNILGLEWSDAAVLDLFAGTGALGIEALSRGASVAVFVDNDSYANQIIEKNLSILGLRDKACLFRKDVFCGLGFLRKLGFRFDAVFVDPPYGRGLAQRTLELLPGEVFLKPGARIIAECDRQEELSAPEGFRLEGKVRSYGRTRVGFFVEEGLKK